MPEVRARGGEANTIAALVFACFIGALVQTIVIPIQSELPELLGADRAVTAWVITATIAAACAFSPVTGRLGDLYGRRRLVLILIGVLLAGSAISAVSTSVGPLIVGRALQGAAVGLIPLSMAIMKDAVSPPRLPLAFALTAGMMGIGAALGIPIGAVIVSLLDWHTMFWLCLLLGIVCLGWVVWAVPATAAAPGGRFDLWGAAGNVLGSAALIIGLSSAVGEGWLAPLPLTALCVGAVLVVATTVRLWLSPSPLLDVRASFSRVLLLTNTVSALLNFGMMSMLIIFPQLLTLPVDGGSGLGVDPMTASAIMTASGLAQFAVTPLSARLGRTVDAVVIVTVAGALLAAALGLALVLPPTVPATFVVLLIGGAAIGMGFAAVPRIILRSVSPSDIAAANGLNAQIRMFGTAGAAAIIGAVLAAQSTAGIPDAGAFRTSLVIAVLASIAAAGMAMFIPRSSRLPG